MQVVLGLSSHLFIFFFFFFFFFFVNFCIFFSTLCFPGSITIRLDTLWAQLLEFSTDHFKIIMRTYSKSSVNVHVVWGYRLFIFYHFFLLFRLIFFPCSINFIIDTL